MIGWIMAGAGSLGLVALLYSVIRHLRATAALEVDLDAANRAVAEARERVLKMEAAEAEARRRRLDKIEQEAGRIVSQRSAAAAADLLNQVTRRSKS